MCVNEFNDLRHRANIVEDLGNLPGVYGLIKLRVYWHIL